MASAIVVPGTAAGSAVVYVHDNSFLAPLNCPGTASSAVVSTVATSITSAPPPPATAGSAPNAVPTAVSTATASVNDSKSLRHSPFALIILNSPDTIAANGSSGGGGGSGTVSASGSSVLSHVWSTAAIRIAADGASSRIYRAVPEQYRSAFVPDIICGDFDSSVKPILQFYAERGTELTHWIDEDSTDLDKCLTLIKQRQTPSTAKSPSQAHAPTSPAVAGAKLAPSKAVPAVSTVVIYGAFGGRFDHTMASIQTLYKFGDSFDRLVLCGEGNCTELLRPGKHQIHCHPRLQPSLSKCKSSEGSSAGGGGGTACGLIPIGSAASHVTTAGLKWNVVNATLAFGGLISTSNLIASDTVTIDTADSIVWTSALASA